MKSSPHASFKSLTFAVEKIALMYFSSKKQIRENQIYSFSSGNKEISNPFYLIVSKVESAFGELDNVEKVFINNDFFHECYPFWWVTIYSKCTYYRYKRKAMIHFLKAYEK